MREMRHDVLQGDCLSVLRDMERSQVDLVYLDPPFLTQKTQTLLARDRMTEFSFADYWASEDEYRQFVAARLSECHRVLKPSGSIFFHCDRNASHIARYVLDEIFGDEMFRAEIIWSYKRWTNSQKTLIPSHQTIYFYSKSASYKFHTLYQDYSASTNVDQILQRRKRDEHGKSIYERDTQGRIVLSEPKRGVALGDVWEIPYLNPKARERVGYPTQKPVLLLERIIELSTDPGDLVVDPFCGSGTTLVAAKLLERNAIGIDLAEEAIKLTRKRIESPVRSDSELLRKGLAAYKTADEKALAFLQGVDVVPVQRNRGIDAFLKESVGGGPVPIRVQRQGETMVEAVDALYAAGRSKGATKMIMIRTNVGGELDLELQFPPEVEVIMAPAAEIRTKLGRWLYEVEKAR